MVRLLRAKYATNSAFLSAGLIKAASCICFRTTAKFLRKSEKAPWEILFIFVHYIFCSFVLLFCHLLLFPEDVAGSWPPKCLHVKQKDVPQLQITVVAFAFSVLSLLSLATYVTSIESIESLEWRVVSISHNKSNN